MDQKVDIVINGGGLVGCALGLFLSRLPITVALIDSSLPPVKKESHFDARSIVLSYSSYKIFKSLGVWELLKPYAKEIKHIHVSEKGRFGATRLDAASEGADAFGYVIEMNYLYPILNKTLGQKKNIHLYYSSNITNIKKNQNGYTVSFKNNVEHQTLLTSLLVGADGAQSFVRKYLDIDATEKPYGHVALAFNVGVKLKHPDTAIERFTKVGPMALLPLSSDRAGFIWGMPEATMSEISQYTDERLIETLQLFLGHRVGKITSIGKKGAFPLNFTSAKAITKDNAVLVGNAAQSLHPIAAQGFNLGLRDVSVLAELIETACEKGNVINYQSLLKDYEKKRFYDRLSITCLTHFLVKYYTSKNRFVSAFRGLNMCLVDNVKPLKHLLSRHTMGVASYVPEALIENNTHMSTDKKLEALHDKVSTI